MAMGRRNFDREYPRVRFASSVMTRHHSQDANPRTGNRNWSGRRGSRALRQGTISLDRGRRKTNESTAVLGTAKYNN
jgi:hypothetical protein